jgi:hypothetical protein
LQPHDALAHLTYTQLLTELSTLSDDIDRYRDMTPDEEREFRRTTHVPGAPLPEDFRDIFIVQAGLRQVEIVRECLNRVDVGTLARDTGYPTASLILLSCYRGNPPDPASN